MSGSNFASTRITPLVYVSTGAVHYQGEPWGDRWQYETCIFSDDPRQRFRQVIHGSSSVADAPHLRAKALHVHERIASGLTEKFATHSVN